MCTIISCKIFNSQVATILLLWECIVFQQREDWRELEIDVMANLVTLPEEASDLLEPVEHKIGFIRLPHKELYPFFKSDIHEQSQEDKENDPSTEVEYISPFLIKAHLQDANILGDPVSYLKSLSMGIVNIEYRHVSTETTTEINLGLRTIAGTLFSQISVDYVPAVRLLFWPHQAAAWRNRQRLWPPQDIVQSIVNKGCQLVPRSSPGGNVYTEWRLSFSGAEALLAQLRSKKQQLDYYFFKILFYQYLKSVESSEPAGKSLFSYVMKTIMLWACEELSPEDPIWESLESSVQMLLFKLLGSLEAEFLAHYFIPEINLLERVGEDVKIKCIAIINTLQKDILIAAPFDMPEKRKFANWIHDITICAKSFFVDQVENSQSD